MFGLGSAHFEVPGIDQSTLDAGLRSPCSSPRVLSLPIYWHWMTHSTAAEKAWAGWSASLTLIAAMLDSEDIYQKVKHASTWQMDWATNRDFESPGPGEVHPMSPGRARTGRISGSLHPRLSQKHRHTHPRNPAQGWAPRKLGQRFPYILVWPGYLLSTPALACIPYPNPKPRESQGPMLRTLSHGPPVTAAHQQPCNRSNVPSHPSYLIS